MVTKCKHKETGQVSGLTYRVLGAAPSNDSMRVAESSGQATPRYFDIFPGKENQIKLVFLKIFAPDKKSLVLIKRNTFTAINQYLLFTK